MKNVTVVSACDRNFLWGAWLLGASCARFLPENPVHLLQTGFTDADRKLIEQFPTVKLLTLGDNDPRSVANRKSESLLSADTEYVAWLDADCMVIGDVSELLVPANGEFQIRLRPPAENAWVWRNHYAPGEPRGGLPRSVQAQWRQDVGQRAEPACQTTCVTNAFVLHRRHLDFVRQWKEQIARVIPARHAGVVDHTINPAYFMVDESVMSSLLSFSNIAPPVSEFRLDHDPARHVAHFGANPKPWVQWRLRLWYCYPHILDLIDWARANHYQTPPIPSSFAKQNRSAAYLKALGSEARSRIRSTGGNVLRALGLRK
jgi:hypothetical protein